ncbi:hypothetical protein ACFWY6_19900 [Streptomyces sp. NPDC059037]|uniref:hypothetical protein n=1 Tax=Streptomyces sp. NPDC059037 TaxID=3346710 RepID=UPI0036CC2C38
MTDDSHAEAAEGTALEATEKRPVGALVIDMRRQRLGRVMGHEGPYVQLRPPGGGREWDGRPEDIREAKDDEILRASVYEVSHATPGRTP